MNKTVLFLTLLVIALGCQKNDEKEPEPVKTGPTPLTWTKPAGFPDPVYDLSRNPLTEEGVELGRFLFYDGILSRTNQVGCGTCHQQQAAFTHHGHELSHGVDDRLGVRNSPAVQNMAWSDSFFWDGGVHDLDLFPFNPIENPVEMDEKVTNVLDKLRKTPNPASKIPVDYPKMFKAAFGTDEINSERMMKALSQFMVTMVSAGSKYDYYRAGDAAALNTQEKEGLVLFQKNCSSCHAGVLFTDHSFRNNGLAPMMNNDLGRGAITGNEADHYKFKVPSLRNVGLTGPYMHDGRYHSLEEVLDHYTDSVQKLTTLDPLLIQQNGKTGIALTATEKQALIAFLKTLSDEQFIREAKLSDPGIGTAF
ncbi:Cytochrome c551 peroxidase [Dyadobacter sp. CECT 9275]|uniref:Cytochrome c551 peroxidase n=1 Tax=Dyadobacter helix TaxID=2822344 RepID=A0A916N7R4_9BACT|nr:cytochrome c peroxidase [Dyadobacter sp. CECT 9275]CAG5018071.1 Cytochrome c551 peroxidase [Dyadobacter sp. CECT 9275]